MLIWLFLIWNERIKRHKEFHIENEIKSKSSDSPKEMKEMKTNIIVSQSAHEKWTWRRSVEPDVNAEEGEREKENKKW